MMPQLVTVRVRDGRGRRIRLWIPVLPVLLVLSPVLVLAALVAGIVFLANRMNPVRALGNGWRFFCAMPGTRVDVEHGRRAVLVTIR